MRRLFMVVILAFIVSGSALAQTKTPIFNQVSVNGAITPPMAEYILQNIEETNREGRDGLIILLDTPGGLDLAMRDIAKGILNAPIPVMVFVYPAGARAASAGVIITVCRPCGGHGAGNEYRCGPSRVPRFRRRGQNDDEKG